MMSVWTGHKKEGALAARGELRSISDVCEDRTQGGGGPGCGEESCDPLVMSVQVQA